ncbi:MAG: GNAT family N-acetyltransferase [Candidatus Thorarchaeota archaeon]
MAENYYFRDLTSDDWEKFHEIDELVFPSEPINQESFLQGLPGLNTLSSVMIDKETKQFMGYYRINVFGNFGYIGRIGVHPEFRGKGYGALILEKSIFYLEKAGCKKFYLYVLEDNNIAINLYKKFGFEIDTKNIQYEIPYGKLPEKPKGNCRHVEWGEIQLISLRFNQNPFQIQTYFTKENQLVLIYEIMGQQLGFCRFSPNYPGAMPFVLRDPQYFYDFVSHLKTYITNPEFKAVKITVEGQDRLVEFLNNEKAPIKMQLLKMDKVKENDK